MIVEAENSAKWMSSLPSVSTMFVMSCNSVFLGLGAKDHMTRARVGALSCDFVQDTGR